MSRRSSVLLIRNSSALILKPSVVGLRDKVLVAGVGGWRGKGLYRDGFCEKLLEASPMSDRANARWL